MKFILTLALLLIAYNSFALSFTNSHNATEISISDTNIRAVELVLADKNYKVINISKGNNILITKSKDEKLVAVICGLENNINGKVLRVSGTGELKYRLIDKSGKVISEGTYTLTNKIITRNSLLPKTYNLSQNYPNPFNPETVISYAIAGRRSQVAGLESETCDLQPVTLRIYSITGQLVKTLVNESQPAGYYNVKWNGKDDNGKEVSSGTYIYRIIAGNFKMEKKMLVVK
jgi:hypothetical protein